MEEDLQDWEMLDNDTTSINSSSTGIADPESIIMPDYFNIQSNLQELDFEKSSNQVTDEDFEVHHGSGSKEISDFGGNNEEISEDQETEVITKEINGDVSEMVKGVDDGVPETLEANGKEDIDRESQVISDGGLRPVDQGKKGAIWWKVPVEIMRFCVFRVSPVWSISLAAAIMGVVILKRRLSRLRQKSRSIPIKLTVEDKKVSQYMMRASRANEAFSVVRRVPIFRPLLPSAGVTPWPVLNLR
ncbi:hypothetical protein ACHQM5_016734 [Ranunculus cassubicifolius]